MGLNRYVEGAEKDQSYKYSEDGMPVKGGAELTMLPGDIAVVGPTLGDIHVVSNALPNQTSISIHVYGANIGAVKRHIFKANTRVKKNFVSGYSSQQISNLWDKSGGVRVEINK